MAKPGNPEGFGATFGVVIGVAVVVVALIAFIRVSGALPWSSHLVASPPARVAAAPAASPPG
jgi:hypothetical protein